MGANKKTARIAGLLYLIVVITGTINLGYVPGKLIVWDNAQATFNNIIASETLFRLGILSGLICYTAFLLLPFVLYDLFKAVNKTYAVLMVVLAVVSVPISFVNLLNKFAVLSLIGKAAYLKVFTTAELQSQVMLHLRYYSNGNQLAQIFWGLWLFPFGWLVYKSGFLPKILGVFLMAGCFGYLINFTGGFLFHGYSDTAISSYITLPASIGEIGTCLWLLIMGIKNKPAQ
ncbi:DUF4386 domain-containing protein [Mucilaginibacter rigui]|uniref:DUF4386 domain-containing protein n=1 Tax=Mucilaginibacter rigui TaxID=534635 RepID=A0ABR7X122_9SPHI|nr:DUF4386 domain-containing protein [Mucilaginibacter rigui]MBD1384288.1 DUF4386 domain-containing protein [Mucilaginibacter rigui]